MQSAYFCGSVRSLSRDWPEYVVVPKPSLPHIERSSIAHIGSRYGSAYEDQWTSSAFFERTEVVVSGAISSMGMPNSRATRNASVVLASNLSTGDSGRGRWHWTWTGRRLLLIGTGRHRLDRPRRHARPEARWSPMRRRRRRRSRARSMRGRSARGKRRRTATVRS